MYVDAMDAIHTHLVRSSMGNKMSYTSELVPENGPNGELSVHRLFYIKCLLILDIP